MNKEQAVTYLKFSGFSEEQIKAIEGAFTCDKCVYSTSEGCQYDDITETIPPFDKTGWIPVSERLPVLRGMSKISDDVLITNGFENDMGYLVERKGKIFWHYYGGEYEFGIKDEDNDAIAWMPLPEPYKAEGSGE